MTGKSDRELLELAAKAAHIDFVLDGYLHKKGLVYEPLTDCEEGRPMRWNPLEDDGDALRLAGKLRLDLCWNDNNEEWEFNAWPQGGGDGSNEVPNGEEQNTFSMRRAIVRAAAAIGEKMP